MKKTKPQLIVALDVETLGEVRTLVDTLAPFVDIFKVGSQLFTACGPAAVRFIEAHGKKVFLDLKFHDIPNTVGNAVTAAVNLSDAVERTLSKDKKSTDNKTNNYLYMYTLHTVGGVEMMKQAVASATKQAEKLGVTKPLAVGVTVLTSQEKKDNILDLVLERAKIAKRAGLDGIVASVQEAKFIREQFGKEFIIVTPGIRLPGAGADDQKRIATPKEAIEAGSDYIVVGRPIVKADNPRAAVKQILAEIDKL